MAETMTTMAETLRTVAVTIPRLGAMVETRAIIYSIALVGSAAAVSVTAVELVRRCVIAGLGPCRSPVNIFILGAEHGEHTQHVREAIEEDWSRSLLRRKPGKPHDRGWIDAYRGPGRECQNTQRGSGYDCDEYPYAATEEGGQFGDVSLRRVNSNDNQAGGNALKVRFYDRCQVPAGPNAERFLVVATELMPITSAVCKS